MEIDKKTNSSSISDGETDHKAASRENKIKGMGHFIPVQLEKKESYLLKLIISVLLTIGFHCLTGSRYEASKSCSSRYFKSEVEVHIQLI